MVLSILFWVAVVAAYVVIGLKFLGFNYIELATVLVIFALITVELERRKDKKLFTNELKHELLAKTDKLEALISQNLGSNVKEELKTEIKDSVDRVAAKAIDIENKINDVKKNLMAVSQAFDERMKVLESEVEENKVTVSDIETTDDVSAPFG